LGNQQAARAKSDLVGLPDVMVQAGSHLATYFSTEAGRSELPRRSSAKASSWGSRAS
jgi:hypothetical protein